MKKSLLAFIFTVLSVWPVVAVERGRVGVGLDFALPYILTVDGSDASVRGNFNLGVDGRFYLTDRWNLGARFIFDVEEQTGTNRQITLSPGAQYRFMPNKKWSPYLRFDLPVVLRGAVNNAGSSSKVDMGISAGLGLAWNMGDSMGLPGLSLRYDFSFSYLFGISDALPVLGVEFFKIGIDYRF